MLNTFSERLHSLGLDCPRTVPLGPKSELNGQELPVFARRVSSETSQAHEFSTIPPSSESYWPGSGRTENRRGIEWMAAFGYEKVTADIHRLAEEGEQLLQLVLCLLDLRIVRSCFRLLGIKSV